MVDIPLARTINQENVASNELTSIQGGLDRLYSYFGGNDSIRRLMAEFSVADRSTFNHQVRCYVKSIQLVDDLCKNNMISVVEKENLEDQMIFFFFHDIGKVGITDDIQKSIQLMNDTKSSESDDHSKEALVLRAMHVVVGAFMWHRFCKDNGIVGDNATRIYKDIIRHQETPVQIVSERGPKKSYPWPSEKVKEKDLNEKNAALFKLIVTSVDVYDAMTKYRNYKLSKNAPSLEVTTNEMGRIITNEFVALHKDFNGKELKTEILMIASLLSDYAAREENYSRPEVDPSLLKWGDKKFLNEEDHNLKFLSGLVKDVWSTRRDDINERLKELQEIYK